AAPFGSTQAIDRRPLDRIVRRRCPHARRCAERNDETDALNVADARNLVLATQLAEAPKVLPQAVRATTAPTLAEAALMLVRAMRCMLRRTTPEMKTATPPSNARNQRRA